MNSEIWIAIIVMGGAVLGITTWQILAIGKKAMSLDKGSRISGELQELKSRVKSLEEKITDK